MKASDFRLDIYKLTYTAEVNQRYYQLKYTSMWRWDKIIKVSVAALAMLATVCVFLPHEYKMLEFAIAFLAAILAIVLNVIPIGEWMVEHGEKCRCWNDLYICADKLRMMTRDIPDDESVPSYLLDHLHDLGAKQYQLDDEHTGDEALLGRCQEDVNQRMYGGNVRTYEEAVAEHARRSGDIHA